MTLSKRYGTVNRKRKQGIELLGILLLEEFIDLS
jgi:hypothetical protein